MNPYIGSVPAYSPTLLTIAELNTVAVHHYKYGDNANAVPILIEALQMIPQAAVQEQQIQSMEEKHRLLSSTSTSLTSTTSTTTNTTTTTNTQSNNNNNNNDAQYPFHQNQYTPLLHPNSTVQQALYRNSNISSTTNNTNNNNNNNTNTKSQHPSGNTDSLYFHTNKIELPTDPFPYSIQPAYHHYSMDTTRDMFSLPQEQHQHQYNHQQHQQQQHQQQQQNQMQDCNTVGTNDSGMTRTNPFAEMYNGAFLLVDDIPVAAAETAAIVSFNLALIVHREGIKTGQDSLLLKALTLYQQSYNLLGHDGTHLSFHRSIILLVLSAALITNMKHIENKLYTSTTYDNTMASEQMNDLVMFMECDYSVDPDDLHFFQLSVIFLNMATLDIAPAA